MASAKQQLRKALHARRMALDPTSLVAANAALCAAILGSTWWAESSSVAAFVGVRNEPDTWPLLAAAWAQQKALWLPRVHEGALVFVRVHDRESIVPGGFGLLEPKLESGDRGCLQDIAPALVLVPGLAFGRDGARIGFGRGYYDRALAPLLNDTHVRRIGLCYAAFLDPASGPIPMEEHDVPMHAVATEHGLWLCTDAGRSGRATPGP